MLSLSKHDGVDHMLPNVGELIPVPKTPLFSMN